MDKIRKEIKTYFEELKFNEEAHTYEHKSTSLSSVSSTIKVFVKPFESEKIAGFVARSRGVTKEEILTEWREKGVKACKKGTRVHLFGEKYPNDTTMCPSDGYEEAIVKYWTDMPEHIKPFLFELKMYSREYNIAGTADIILYNTKTEKFIIADYKTNIDLFKNHNRQKMLKPFGRLLDNPYNKYQLQLSLYQYLFEQTGYKVEKREIIWLKEDGTYKKYRTKGYINNILKALRGC